MTTAEFSANVLSDIDHRRQLRRAVIASTIGTTIEWYDFLLYSIVTGLVFAKLYFPASDPLIGTMQAYAVLRQNANRFQGEMKKEEGSKGDQSRAESGVRIRLPPATNPCQAEV